MRKFAFAAALAAILAMTIGIGPSAQAQMYGPGMMGGYGYGGGYTGGPGYGYGPGYMMNRGYGPGYGMMGPGYGPGYRPGWMMGPGYGPGYYGGSQGDLNLSVDTVKSYLNQIIQNPNLKVGDVKEKDKDTITADIVTKDKNALVQRFEFNRHTGYYQPEEN